MNFIKSILMHFIFSISNKFEYFLRLISKRAERNHYNHRRTWYWQSTLIDGLTAKGFVVILKSLSNFGSKETRNRAIISENPFFSEH
jgi:hypothetical protein